VIDRALLELAGNQDLEEKTDHDYIVGYLCEALADPARRTSPESADLLQAAERERRRALLEKVRKAIRAANPSGRDLVQELIAERREEEKRG